MKLSDEELVFLIQKDKDVKAFETLMKRYQNIVFSKAMAFVEDSENAKDLTQEIFVKTYFNINQFKHNSSFKSWLYRISVNHCLTFIKNRHRELNLDQVAEIESDTNIETSMETKLDVKKILSAMQIRQKAILLAKYVEGYSYKELAIVFESNQNAIKMEVFRAKKTFEKLYKDN